MMFSLTKKQEQLIRSLHKKKYRREHGLCLVEGEKLVKELGDHIDFTFTRDDSEQFDKLVTTNTPQGVAAVAIIPQYTQQQVFDAPIVLVLDGVQDPGNIGGMFRLALAFGATIALIESADPSSSKVIRSSAGAMFKVPWVELSRKEAANMLSTGDHHVFRLEKRDGAESIAKLRDHDWIVLIIGSEGQGVQLKIDAPSVAIPHANQLESLNVGHATAIALYALTR